MLIRKNTIPLERLPDTNAASLRMLSDSDLYRFIGGWREGSAEYIAGTNELKRRQDSPAQWIAFAALVVSLVSLAVTLLKS